jgi:hypothetical protein
MKLFLVFILAHFCFAQEHLEAYIRILDDKDRAGDLAVYRFTLEIYEGLTVQTYLPSSVGVESPEL